MELNYKFPKIRKLEQEDIIDIGHMKAFLDECVMKVTNEMVNKDLMIYQDIQNETLRLFLDELEKEYGCILCNVGGAVGIDNGKWISPKAIAMIVHQLYKKLQEGLQ